MLPDPNVLRKQADEFNVGLRGCRPSEVAEYLERLALVVDVLAAPGPVPDLPSDVTPEAIRLQEFEIVWRGFARDQVDSFLEQVADDLGEWLKRGPEPTARPSLEPGVARDVFTAEELPKGFEYPEPFKRLVDLGLVDLEPWSVLTGELLRSRHSGLRARYPSRNLVVFAQRVDRDDVACWDLDSGDVSIAHDFASVGWARVERVPDFDAWLRRAVDDFLDFPTA